MKVIQQNIRLFSQEQWGIFSVFCCLININDTAQFYYRLRSQDLFHECNTDTHALFFRNCLH